MPLTVHSIQDKEIKKLKQINPCCGVKHKTAVMTIAITDIIYGIILETMGIIFYSKITGKAGESLVNYKEDTLEVINMIVRPAIVLFVGIILLLSTKFHLWKNGVISMVGCVFWIITQVTLLVITFMRFDNFLSDSSDDPQKTKYLLWKSGATSLETFVILSSILPFATIMLCLYEIVAVVFFIWKIMQDRKLLKYTEDALAQVGITEGPEMDMSETQIPSPGTTTQIPLHDEMALSTGHVSGGTRKGKKKNRKGSGSGATVKGNKKPKGDDSKDKIKKDPLYEVEVVKSSKQKMK